jgi:hypothetical protein
VYSDESQLTFGRKALLAACIMLVSCSAYCPTLQNKATCFSETLVHFQWTTWLYILEDRNKFIFCHGTVEISSIRYFLQHPLPNPFQVQVFSPAHCSKTFDLCSFLNTKQSFTLMRNRQNYGLVYMNLYVKLK